MIIGLTEILHDYWVWKFADLQSGSANMDIILVELVWRRGSEGSGPRSGWDGPVAPPESFELLFLKLIFFVFGRRQGKTPKKQDFYPFRIPQILGSEWEKHSKKQGTP